MSNEKSKGIAALRRSLMRAERVNIDGEMFYFRKLTIAQEQELDDLVKSHQRKDLVPPKDLEKDSTVEQQQAYVADLMVYKQECNKAFRKVTAEIMKYVLLDETNAPFFDQADDVYNELDNVYAEKFLRAYTKFRQGTEAAAAGSEARFPG